MENNLLFLDFVREGMALWLVFKIFYYRNEIEKKQVTVWFMLAAFCCASVCRQRGVMLEN